MKEFLDLFSDKPVVGRALKRQDTLLKVMGKQKYASDYYSDDFLWAGVKRSSYPHAVVKNIDYTQALKVAGVYKILTHKDIKGSNRHGIARKDQEVLVETKVRYVGDPIALVLAENKEALKEAISLIKVEYKPLPAVFDVEDALKEGAPKIHDSGNLLESIHITKGDIKKGFKESDVIVEAVFEVPYQEHAFLETECGWAFLQRNGDLVIIASTQTPFRDRAEVAFALGYDEEKIRVIAPYLGGGFGGKDGITVQCLLGLAALNSGGKPVKMWLSREESMENGYKRHPAKMYYKLGARADGTLTALWCELYFDTGAYASLGVEVMCLAVEHAGGPYKIPNTDITGFCVYTNKPVSGPFRGFGVPQVTFAIEQLIDEIALKLNLDPIEIRLKNALDKGDKNPIGVTMIYSTGLKDCLLALKNSDLWRNKERYLKTEDRFKKRAIGVASIHQGGGLGTGIPDYAQAKIELTTDGKFRVYAGISDMGEGNAVTNLQIAGHLLNQKLENMELILPDTAKTLNSGPAAASRSTYIYGNALIEAINILKSRILKKAMELFGTDNEKEVDLQPGCVVFYPDNKRVSLSEICQMLPYEERVATSRFDMPLARDGLGIGHGLPHILFTYGAHMCLIEIDLLTGKITPLKYVAAVDAGRVINPQLYEQQVEGGVAQGMGYALMEELVVDNKSGKVLTNNFATYLIPTVLDVCEIETIPVCTHEDSGPFGMKGIGEVNINGPAPAIANAVARAIQKRFLRLPLDFCL